MPVTKGGALATTIAVAAASIVAVGAVTISNHGGKVRYPKHWESRVQPLIAFVESTRGLTFKHPVPVRFLDDAAFDKQVVSTPEEKAQDKKDLEQALATLRALGLITGKVDLAAKIDALESASIVGLYVPKKHTVFVRGTSLGPYVRATLAHELTHVLQDQYFDLQKLTADVPGRDNTAVHALIEADAQRVGEAYQKALSAADTRAYAAAEMQAQARAKTGTADIPAFLSDVLEFPYVFGPVLVDALAAAGGNDAIDNAFRHPPTEEAQIFDPLRHPLTEKQLKLATPQLPAGARRLDREMPFGEVSLFLVLGSRLGYAEAHAAVAGWRGDVSLPYSSGGKTCVAADFNTATPAALLTALKHWAKPQPSAVIGESGGRVTLRSCDPGEAFHLKPSNTAFELLAGRAALMHEVLSAGRSLSVASCFADYVIDRLTPEMRGVFSGSAASPELLRQVQALARRAAQSC